MVCINFSVVVVYVRGTGSSHLYVDRRASGLHKSD